MWREWKAWRAIRRTVRPAMDEPNRKKAMADLVGMPGFHQLKAMLMAETIEQVQAKGAKADMAPGLARAVGVVALCEYYVYELAQQEAKARGAKRDVEELEPEES